MQTVHIKIVSGNLVLDPNPVSLGHDDGAHALQWHNDSGTMATVSAATEVWNAVFENPPLDGSIPVGAQHAAPKPPLKLKPHDKRQNGDFTYTVTVGQQPPITGTFHVRP